MIAVHEMLPQHVKRAALQSFNAASAEVLCEVRVEEKGRKKRGKNVFFLFVSESQVGPTLAGSANRAHWDGPGRDGLCRV